MTATERSIEIEVLRYNPERDQEPHFQTFKVPFTPYDAWRAALDHPLMMTFHLVALVLVSYHAYTWWQVAPKTMPTLRLRGKAIAQSAISAGGWAATVVTSVLIVALIAWASR